MKNETSRRGALKAAGNSVLAASVAGLSAFAGEATAQYSRSALEERAKKIVDFATSEQFLSMLRAVLDAPVSRQLEQAVLTFDRRNLEAHGLKLPENTRLSSRIFDERSGKATVLGTIPLTPPATLTLSLPKVGITKPTVDAMLDRNKLLEAAIKNGFSACLCLGAGACVGVGGGD